MLQPLNTSPEGIMDVEEDKDKQPRGPLSQGKRAVKQRAKKAAKQPRAAEDNRTQCDLEEARQFVGSGSRSQVFEELAELHNCDPVQLTDAANRIDHAKYIFSSDWLVIIGFTLSNFTDRKDKLREEVIQLISTFGIRGQVEDIQPLLGHVYGNKCDVMIKLKDRQLFGSMSHSDEEQAVSVIQSHQMLYGKVFTSKSTGTFRRFLMSALDVPPGMSINAEQFRDLAYGRGIPQPGLSHTAFGIQISYGREAVAAVIEGLLKGSRGKVVIYVSFANVAHKGVGGGGEREFFVKVFYIMSELEDTRYDNYLSLLGFDKAATGIIRYSLGIPLLLYDKYMSFETGRDKSGDLRGNVAYSVISPVPYNVSPSTILLAILLSAKNRAILLKDGIMRIKMGLLFPYPGAKGKSSVYFIWDGTPAGDMDYTAMRTLFGNLTVEEHPALFSLQKWGHNKRSQGAAPVSMPPAPPQAWRSTPVQILGRGGRGGRTASRDTMPVSFMRQHRPPTLVPPQQTPIMEVATSDTITTRTNDVERVMEAKIVQRLSDHVAHLVTTGVATEMEKFTGRIDAKQVEQDMVLRNVVSDLHEVKEQAKVDARTTANQITQLTNDVGQMMQYLQSNLPTRNNAQPGNGTSEQANG